MANEVLRRLGDFLLLKAVGRSAAQIRFAARTRLIQAALMAAAIVIGLFALFWGLVALFFYLGDYMSMLEASGWIAGGLLALMIFLFLTARLLPGCSSGAAQDRGGEEKDPAAAMMGEIKGMMAESSIKASLAALVVGLVVGYSPKVRAMLLKALGGKDKESP